MPFDFGTGFKAWYCDKLDNNPLPTKSLTGLFLWGLGDVVAQGIPLATKKVNSTCIYICKRLRCVCI